MFLVMGPGVSYVDEIGTIPVLLNSPIVGFRPAREPLLEGDSIDPEVSVPTAAAAKLAAMAAPLPELEPPVSKILRPYGFSVWPPTAL